MKGKWAPNVSHAIRVLEDAEEMTVCMFDYPGGNIYPVVVYPRGPDVGAAVRTKTLRGMCR